MPDIAGSTLPNSLLMAIVNEVGALDRAWTLFCATYFDKGRADTIRRILPIGGSVIAIALQRDMGLMIARLLDPPEAALRGEKRPNVSLAALMLEIGVLTDGDVGNEHHLVVKSYQQCDAICRRFVAGRNRLIAHLDRRSHLEGNSLDLPLLEETGRAIDALKIFLDAVAEASGRPRIRWNEFACDRICDETQMFFDAIAAFTKPLAVSSQAAAKTPSCRPGSSDASH